jgi:hypothetical protein
MMDLPEELILKTSIELKRLGWTDKQGRDYLVQTYGKRSRHLLTDEELLEFFYYLQSLSTSTTENINNVDKIDFLKIVAKTDIELKRLGWTNEQGRDYLLQTYGKRSRFMLTDEKLLEFLDCLKNLPTPIVAELNKFQICSDLSENNHTDAIPF